MAVGGNDGAVASRLRVLIVEDEAGIRRDAEAALRREGVIAIGVERGQEAIAAARVEGFDAALVDLGLPDMPGIEVIAGLRRAAAACTPVAFTVFDDAPTILAALRAGARGYLLKSSPTARIVSLLRDAIAGGMPLSPGVASLVVETMLGDASGPRTLLSERERALLALLARGATYTQCAETLGIGLGTVQQHVRSIYAALDASHAPRSAALP